MVGGVFSTRPDSAYDGLHLTTSNFLMAYSDFPPKDDWIKRGAAQCSRPARAANPRRPTRFSRKEEYAKYLENYANHFNLRPKIRFETRARRRVGGGRKLPPTDGPRNRSSTRSTTGRIGS